MSLGHVLSYVCHCASSLEIRTATVINEKVARYDTSTVRES